VGKNVFYYPDKVSSLFPQGKLLVDMGAVGYAACPLWDSHGIGIGLLCVISTQPLQNQSLVETIIQIVGTRAAQEIEAMSHLEELVMKNFTIENMTDAVFWIYSDGRVWNANESACRSLGYTKEELLSKSVLDFAPEFSYDTWPTNWQELRDTGNLRFESSHKDKLDRVFPKC
jgi:PAS domain-containing protein